MLKYLIVFIISSQILSAQEADTMLNKILDIENDTERVNQLYTRGFDLVDKNPQLAFKYAQNCELTARKSKSPRHISKSYNLSGILFYKQGDLKKSLFYFRKYLVSTQELNNGLGVAFSLTNLGHIYLQLKQFPKAEKHYLLALEYYNAQNNKIELANGLINLGVLKHEQNQLDAAFENYQTALQMGIALNNYDIKAICLNNIAQVYFDKGDFGKALSYNFDALEIREIMGLEADLADSYLSIAEITIKQGDLALAQENLDSALELCNKLEYYEGKMTYHKLLAELYYLKNNYQLAYQNLKVFTQLNDSIITFQEDEPLYDLEENRQEPIEEDFEFDKITNKPMMFLLLIIIIFISYIIFKNKR